MFVMEACAITLFASDFFFYPKSLTPLMKAECRRKNAVQTLLIISFKIYSII